MSKLLALIAGELNKVYPFHDFVWMNSRAQLYEAIEREHPELVKLFAVSNGRILIRYGGLLAIYDYLRAYLQTAYPGKNITFDFDGSQTLNAVIQAHLRGIHEPNVLWFISELDHVTVTIVKIRVRVPVAELFDALLHKY